MTQPSSTAFYYSPLAADPDLLEIVAEFVDALGSRLADFDAAYERRDWVRLAQLAHQLKGAAGSYGFEALSDVMGGLELMLPASESEVIGQKLTEARHVVSLVRAEPPPGT